MSDVSSQPPQPLPPPPGWYPDPGGTGGQRWWDGTRWTEHVSAPGLAPPITSAAAQVPPRYQQKWWHLPLVVGLAVLATTFWIVVQLLTA